MRSSYTHRLYPDNNGVVYFKLEKETQGTSFANSIKPSRYKEDGRGAHFAPVAQYAGIDNWEVEINKNQL